MATPAPIEFWFDFSSPYAYFASHSIAAVAAEAGRAVRWRPFMLGAAFKATGMRPLTLTPIRGDYARRDWARLARLMDLPFRLPARHPYTALAVSRAFYWIEQAMPERAPGFARAAFRAHFEDGRDLTGAAAVAELAEAAGAPSDRVAAAIESPAIKEHLRRRTDEALAKGVFGSPFFIVDGEPFWGWDRMALMRQWMDRGGW